MTAVRITLIIAATRLATGAHRRADRTDASSTLGSLVQRLTLATRDAILSALGRLTAVISHTHRASVRGVLTLAATRADVSTASSTYRHALARCRTCRAGARETSAIRRSTTACITVRESVVAAAQCWVGRVASATLLAKATAHTGAIVATGGIQSATVASARRTRVVAAAVLIAGVARVGTLAPSAVGVVAAHGTATCGTDAVSEITVGARVGSVAHTLRVLVTGTTAGGRKANVGEQQSAEQDDCERDSKKKHREEERRTKKNKEEQSRRCSLCQ